MKDAKWKMTIHFSTKQNAKVVQGWLKREYGVAVPIEKCDDVKKTKQKNGKLRLFVWEDVLSDYTSGIAFAFAHDAEEAWALVSKEVNDSVDYLKRDWRREPDVYDIPIAFALYGGG